MKYTWLSFLILLCLSQPLQAERIDGRRVISPEQLKQLGGLQAVAVMRQRSPGVLVVDPRVSGAPNLHQSYVVPKNWQGSRFAYGASQAAIGFMIEKSGQLGLWRLLEQDMQDLLHAMGPMGDDFDSQATWLVQTASTLRASGLVVDEVVSSTSESDAHQFRDEHCPSADNCLLVITRWGLTPDARRLETQTDVLIWSPMLRKPGKRAEKLADYENVLVYRSIALDLPDDKSAADRELLVRSAEQAFLRKGIPQMVELTKSRRKSIASNARREVVPLLETHRERLKDAKAEQWTSAASAIRRAQRWGENRGERLTHALQEAIATTQSMLALELSAKGQSLKPVEKFRWRDRRKVFSMVESGARTISYLHDGTLISQAADEEAGVEWSGMIVLDEVTPQAEPVSAQVH